MCGCGAQVAGFARRVLGQETKSSEKHCRSGGLAQKLLRLSDVSFDIAPSADVPVDVALLSGVPVNTGEDSTGLSTELEKAKAIIAEIECVCQENDPSPAREAHEQGSATPC